VAVRAGWTWALFPYAVFCATTQVWSESLSAFLLSLIFLLALRLEQGARRRAWWGTGLLTGLAALVNPAVLSVLFALLVWVCFRLRQRRVKWVGPLGVALFALVMAVLPWGARNYLVFGRLMPLRDNFWLEVRIGNTGDTSDVDPEWAHPSRPGSELEEFRRLGELNYMAEKRRQAVEFIATRPGTFLWLTIRRAVFVWTGFWSLSPGYLALEPMEPANIVFCTTLTVLMAVGLRAAWRDRKAAAIPYALFLLSFPLVYYLTHPTLNYRHPIDPAIVVLAVYGAITLFSRVRL
jgi:4-amino-4-deoxy-L-arabinose transferase-like glycosyltransferase